MPKKKTRKPAKRAATKKSAKPRSGAKKKAAGGKKRAAAQKPASVKASGSGLVYTDLLREALAGRYR